MEEKRVLCVSCKKPIHIDDLGAITKEGIYHKQLPCVIGLSDDLVKNTKKGQNE